MNRRKGFSAYGNFLLVTILLFIVAAPTTLYIMRSTLPRFLYDELMILSLGVGGAMLLLLSILLAVEYGQERKNEHIAPPQVSRRRIKLPSGEYKCEVCGSFLMEEEDKICGFCGTIFDKPEEEEPPPKPSEV